MKTFKIGLSLVVAAALAWLAWNYFAGPLRYKREMHAFADSLEVCEAFSETVFMYLGNQSLLHTVEGASEQKCGMRMETPGPDVVSCSFALSDLPAIAQGFRDLANSVDMFGAYTYQYDSSDPDPLTQALNSEACESQTP